MIAVLGAGAFGTALAISLSREARVTLWTRDAGHAAEMRKTRRNDRRLPGVDLPENITVSANIGSISDHDIVLLAVPMQRLRGLLEHHGERYQSVGRWVVIAGIGVGAIAGIILQINADIALLAALLAGGILFNTLNHEIESPSQTNYLVLVVSATVFGAILLLS